MTLHYSRRALSQLASVHEYLSSRNEQAAEHVTVSIATTIARLRELPLLGRMTDEPAVRVIIEPQYLYRIFYRVHGDVVYVIRVLHGRHH
jgi:addiction module RelE/StbE family toxin